MIISAAFPEPGPASDMRTGKTDGAPGEAGSRRPDAAATHAKWLALRGRVQATRPGALYWRRQFAGTTEHISQARRFTRFLLADSTAAIDASWVVGELATNAVRHSRSGSEEGLFAVEVMCWDRSVQVQVTDAGGGREPVSPKPDAETVIAGGEPPPESGLGLCGIGALACQFGTYQQTDGSRVVWARLPAEPLSAIGTER